MSSARAAGLPVRSLTEYAVDSGRMEAAKTAAAQISQDHFKAWVYYGIAGAQAKAGDMAGVESAVLAALKLTGAEFLGAFLQTDRYFDQLGGQLQALPQYERPLPGGGA